MNVTLLRRTAEPETAVALAARLCYSPDRIGDLERGLDAAAAASLIRRIVGLGPQPRYEWYTDHATFPSASGRPGMPLLGE